MSSIIVKVPWLKNHGPDLSKPPEGVSAEDWAQWSKDYSVCSDQNTGAMETGDPVKIQINYVPTKITLAIEKLAASKGAVQYVETVPEESTPTIKAVVEI